MKLKKVFAMLLACALALQVCPIFSFAEGNGDEYTRTLEIRTDMVHDNPGGTPYITEYDNVEFLAERGLTGKVFFLSESAHLAIDWQDYDPNVFPVGSDGYNWVQTKKAEYTAKYKEAKDAGLKVYFMMDFVSLPNSMKTLYGDQILTNDKIDINKLKTKEIMAEMMREIFEEFPDIDGIYPRYGESYVGFYSGHHFGNNPIGVSGTKANDHATLLKFFRDEVCEKLDKEIVYRTWSTETGSGSFTTSPELYLEITNQVEPHENLYIAIKHTAGDFWRNYTFNQTIGIGKHQQIIEIQCAREYEGKGAHPNYIAGGVINGFPEYEWQMSDSENKCLRDVVNKENSLVVGIWTWSRGGGWGGPYINGEEGKEDGSELWCDLNAYVLHKWAQDTSQNDEDLIVQYAKEELGMSDKDAESFLQIALKSSDAVLYGKGTNSAPTINVLWMRDTDINPSFFNSVVDTMYSNKAADGSYPKLEERRLSVSLWNEMTELAASLDDSLPCKDFIEVTCQYGLDLYSITERLFTAAILTKEMGVKGSENVPLIAEAVADYDRLMAHYQSLAEYAYCPTLYNRGNFDTIMANYRYNMTSTPILNLNKGESKSAGLAISSYDISEVEFYSSDESIATVSSNGTVTAVGNGIARISMVTKDGIMSTATMVYVGQAATDITAADVASTITSVKVKETDTRLTLPAMPDGFTVKLTASSDTKLVTTAGKVNLSANESEVYLNFTVTKTKNNTNAKAENVYTYLPASMVNLALSGTAFDDGNHTLYDGNKNANNVNDGDTAGEGWQYRDGVTDKRLTDAWLGIKLSEVSTVSQVAIHWEKGSRCSPNIGGYEVEYSLDGETWNKLPNAYYEYDTDSGDIVKDAVTFIPAVQAKYIRVNCYTVDNGKGYCPKIYEIEIFGVADASSNPPAEMLGDVNGDGKINSTDFMQIRRQYLGLYDMTEKQMLLADVNKDGKVNSTDFMQVRRHFLGLFNIFA